MDIGSLKLIYFSPTQTTKKILEAIAQGIQAARIDRLDLTPPSIKAESILSIQDDFAIIGAPVYGGRVALEAVNRIDRLRADRIPAAIVVLYGNRAYEDALLELKNIVEAAGFTAFAAGVFVGEHSFSTEARPIALKRPDGADLEKAKEFGRKIREKIRDIHRMDEMPPLKVPGNLPFKERKARPKISPTTKEALCTLCGTCAAGCPTGAISVNHTVITDPDGCTLCCACIKTCPAQARVFDAAPIEEIKERLFKTCRERKEPEIYI